MGGLATAVLALGLLPPARNAAIRQYRRPLSFRSVVDGFRIVFTNRVAFFYGLAGTFLFGAMFGFIIVEPADLCRYLRARAVFPGRLRRHGRADGGRRRSSIRGSCAASACAGSATRRMLIYHRLQRRSWLVAQPDRVRCRSGCSSRCCSIIQFIFGWAASNMNSLSMEPLGAVAGTAAAVFGFIQTVGGALLGTLYRPALQRHADAQRASATSRWARWCWSAS